jgi:hypothetical protein
LGLKFGTLGEQSSNGGGAGHRRIIADELGRGSKGSSIKHVSEEKKLYCPGLENSLPPHFCQIFCVKNTQHYYKLC